MIKIVVHGAPKAQQRPRFSKNAFGLRVYDPCREEKREFRDKIRSQAPREPFYGGVYLNVTFYLKRPLSHYISRNRDNKLKPEAPIWRAIRPDIDNFIKLVMDSLDDFIKDDSQICRLSATKKYSIKPKTVIEIGELEDDTKSKTKATRIL
jgi:Holliday junction resolvase RusA-like endonuclease|tara:strand:- start:928 stop:1380 length:453 start_codon:yes stop_codon:yes gene_type:complete